MSFLSATEFILDGSGLQDVFNVVYAHASTDKMLDAYPRTIRTYILCNLAIGQVIFSRIELY